MRPSFAKETIERLRYPLVTTYNTPIRDYTATPTVAVIGEPLPGKGCWLEPLVSIEQNGDRTAVYSGYNVDAPADADVLYDDHVRYLGVEFEVDGQPLHVKSPTGALDATRFVLHRWEG